MKSPNFSHKKDTICNDFVYGVFLAAMSSSRSDVVTNSVHSFVMKEFFFSIKSYNGVSRKCKGCFNEV